MAKVLMCPPTHYGIRYEINPWMRVGRDADHARAVEQWQRLHDVLTRRCGLEVELVDPHPDWPDMVFTANAGLVTGRTWVASNFRHPERAGETNLFGQWFVGEGYNAVRLPPECHFEGEGDALWANPGGEDGARGPLLAGWRFRSDTCSHQRLGEILGVEVISLELADRRFYHLDTCLAPLDGRSAIVHMPAFDDYARRVLASTFEDIIELPEAEAERFAANAVVAGRSVVVNAGCPKLSAALAGRGWEVFAVELDEFIKAGGSAKCLTLFLER